MDLIKIPLCFFELPYAVTLPARVSITVAHGKAYRKESGHVLPTS